MEGMTERRRDGKREEMEMKEKRKEQGNKDIEGEKEEDGVKKNTLTKDLKEKLHSCVHCAHTTVYNYNSHQQCREKPPEETERFKSYYHCSATFLLRCCDKALSSVRVVSE